MVRRHVFAWDASARVLNPSPIRVARKSISVADDNQLVTRPRNTNAHSPHITYEAERTLVVGSDCAEDDIILLTALTCIYGKYVHI